MNRKLSFFFGAVLAALAVSVVFIVRAQSAPAEKTWTMYSVGLNNYYNYHPFYFSQEQAADEWFRVSMTRSRLCVRWYYNNTRTGPYRDARYKDGAWEHCDRSNKHPFVDSNTGVAPARVCSESSTESKCFSHQHQATRKNLGPPACEQAPCGNPIAAATGNKSQTEVDFEVPGSPWLSLVRYYNSSPFSAAGAFGANFSHSLEYRLTSNTSSSTVELLRPDGSSKLFVALSADGDEQGSLDVLLDSGGSQTGWIYQDGTSQMESYDMQGRVRRVDFIGGGFIVYAYTGASSVPDSISDHFGRSLSIQQVDGLVTSITVPSGSVYRYTYSDAVPRLLVVSKPSGTSRRYVWDELAYDATDRVLGQLTGIIDESGVRFATFRYDKKGRAISTEHAGGVNKHTISYDSPSGVVQTLPLGPTRTYQTATILGRVLSTGSTLSCVGEQCSANETSTFDGRGNLVSFTTPDGFKTCNAYEPGRALITRQVSGLPANFSCDVALSQPPASSRTVAVEWHPQLRLPLHIAEPSKRTSYGYNNTNQVASITEQATVDASGAQGLQASAVGPARRVSFVRDALGLIREAHGPRQGAVEYFAYDASGNLERHQNALGQATSYGDYDRDGRPRQMTRPNGSIVTLGYDAEGRLTSISSAGLQTSIRFDAVGRLAEYRYPDGLTLNYGYDAAGRLTSITDHRGNARSLSYNAAGGVTRQEMRYPNGSVFAELTQEFDGLNRLVAQRGAHVTEAAGVLLRP